MIMSSETNTKFFDFMKKLVSCCEEKDAEDMNKKLGFKTSLDLCNFNSAQDFVENQMGDKHLPS